MSGRTGNWLQFGGAAILCCGFLAPIALGLWQTVLPAFGFFPALGANTFSLEAWTTLFTLPGVWSSVRLTVFTGFLATLLSLGLAVAFCASVHGRIGARQAERMLSPLLAAPHAAMAIGIAFLLAPSGWLARLVSPWATGWAVPPAIATVHDQLGLTLVFGLMVKEVPFLLLMIIAALNQIATRQQLAAGRALGYGRGVIWIKIIFPQVYRQIRLPVYAVLAFSLSVIDMAIILGPSNPPVLSVATMRWFLSANVDLLLPAAAASIFQIGVVVAGIAGWWVFEKLAAGVGRAVIRRGGRGLESEPLIRFASLCVLLLFITGFMAILSLLLWSFGWRWSFPDALPSSWSVSIWLRSSSGWLQALANTAYLGFGSTALSLLLAIIWLEGEDRSGRRLALGAPAMLYLPLLIPQIGFLYGLQVTFLRAGIDGSMAAVLWGHTLFVFPYVMLALSDPWRALDRRYLRTAAALGASPLRSLFSLKMPLLLRPLLAATAVGFAVSASQYLTTLFLGAGRVATLTTEAVTLSSGGDRRVIGVYATLQAVVPLLVYGVAFYIPRMVYANRADLNGETA